MNMKFKYQNPFFFLVAFSFFSLMQLFGENRQSLGFQHLVLAGAQVSQDIQTDFGRLERSGSNYLEVWPSTTEEVAFLVKIAYEHDIPIRTQGGAHSENGNSLPRKGELLIHTSKLLNITFSGVGYITVDAGVSVFLLNKRLKEIFGYFIPVVNGGGAGPTIGGFVSAGGIGEQSKTFGGLWENVNSITLVTSNGKINKITKHNPMFLFLFGSMGQLGIVAQVELSILPIINQSDRDNQPDNQTIEYPHGHHIVMEYSGTNGKYWKESGAERPLYWFNLFVSPDRLSEARGDLLKLQKKYSHAIDFISIYHWPVKNIDKMPPLIYHHDDDFIALGILGPKSNSSQAIEELFHLEDDFNKLVLEKRYRRYIQTEFTASPQYYKSYYSKKTYNQFEKIKIFFDPKFLFNRGSFFNR